MSARLLKWSLDTRLGSPRSLVHKFAGQVLFRGRTGRHSAYPRKNQDIYLCGNPAIQRTTNIFSPLRIRKCTVDPNTFLMSFFVPSPTQMLAGVQPDMLVSCDGQLTWSYWICLRETRTSDTRLFKLWDYRTYHSLTSPPALQNATTISDVMRYATKGKRRNAPLPPPVATCLKVGWELVAFGVASYACRSELVMIRRCESGRKGIPPYCLSQPPDGAPYRECKRCNLEK